MFRRLSLFSFLTMSVALTACGGSTSTTSSLSAALNAKPLAIIKPPAWIPGPLDGQSTRRNKAIRRPLAVIIENYDPDSRPQSGLSRASTVIETLAEGGVTRFMAIYLEHDASKVGPVRSTRMYFDHWAAAFHAILAHVGGNDDAQALLWHLPKVFNIDENRWERSLYDTGTPLFWRSQDRVAPHNMYVNTAKLRAYAARNGQNWAYAGASFIHKTAAPATQRGKVKTITVNFVNPIYPQPEPGYDVRYQFNAASDTYTRFMGGAPHVDALNNQTLRPANVVVLKTGPARPDPAAGPTPQSILIPTVGSGRAYVFRDGKVVQGKWRQANQYAPLKLLTKHGKPVALNPGQTWIEVVPSSSSFSWS